MSYSSTNIDDIFILLAFFTDSKFKPRQIITGQYLGIGALFLISALGSLVSLVLAPEYVGLLGIAPILIGLKKLYDLIRGEEESEEYLESHGSNGRILAVAAVTMANGGDNIGIYTPLFATRSAVEIVVIGIVFVLMTALWLLLAHWLVSHRTIGAPIRRYGYKVVPFVLVALGIIIMVEAGTFGLIVN